MIAWQRTVRARDVLGQLLTGLPREGDAAVASPDRARHWMGAVVCMVACAACPSRATSVCADACS